MNMESPQIGTPLVEAQTYDAILSGVNSSSLLLSLFGKM